MSKRGFERKNVKVEARFFYGSSIPSCKIKNISESGMCIISEIRHSLNSIVSVIIPSGKKMMDFPVKIIRMEAGNNCNLLGVKVLSPTSEYLEFVDSL